MKPKFYADALLLSQVLAANIIFPCIKVNTQWNFDVLWNKKFGHKNLPDPQTLKSWH